MQINLKNIVLFCCFVVFSQHLFCASARRHQGKFVFREKEFIGTKLKGNESLDDLLQFLKDSLIQDQLTDLIYIAILKWLLKKQRRELFYFYHRIY